MNFPEEIVVGDTLDFGVSVPDYPATAGWTLKYRLTPRFATPPTPPVTLTAAPDGSDYRITVGPATTSLWTAGAYTWARWVEKSGARQTLNESGQLLMKADPATTNQGFDSRSHARKVLEAIQAILEDRSSSTQRELVAYTIGSRSQQFDQADTKASLIELKSKYEWLVANEDARDAIAAGLPNPRLIRVRFGAP